MDHACSYIYKFCSGFICLPGRQYDDYKPVRTYAWWSLRGIKPRVCLCLASCPSSRWAPPPPPPNREPVYKASLFHLDSFTCSTWVHALSLADLPRKILACESYSPSPSPPLLPPPLVLWSLIDLAMHRSSSTASRDGRLSTPYAPRTSMATRHTDYPRSAPVIPFHSQAIASQLCTITSMQLMCGDHLI